MSVSTSVAPTATTYGRIVGSAAIIGAVVWPIALYLIYRSEYVTLTPSLPRSLAWVPTFSLYLYYAIPPIAALTGLLYGRNRRHRGLLLPLLAAICLFMMGDALTTAALDYAREGLGFWASVRDHGFPGRLVLLSLLGYAGGRILQGGPFVPGFRASVDKLAAAGSSVALLYVVVTGSQGQFGHSDWRWTNWITVPSGLGHAFLGPLQVGWEVLPVTLALLGVLGTVRRLRTIARWFTLAWVVFLLVGASLLWRSVAAYLQFAIMWHEDASVLVAAGLVVGPLLLLAARPRAEHA